MDGWLLGHHLAAGREDFPGDPWPDGHPGSIADLGFWGAIGGGDDLEDEDPW